MDNIDHDIEMIESCLGFATLCYALEWMVHQNHIILWINHCQSDYSGNNEKNYTIKHRNEIIIVNGIPVTNGICVSMNDIRWISKWISTREANQRWFFVPSDCTQNDANIIPYLKLCKNTDNFSAYLHTADFQNVGLIADKYNRFPVFVRYYAPNQRQPISRHLSRTITCNVSSIKIINKLMLF